MIQIRQSISSQGFEHRVLSHIVFWQGGAEKGETGF